MALPDPYYQDGAVTLYCGDCLEILPDIGPVDHVITDPPYEAEAHTLQRRTMTDTRSGRRRPPGSYKQDGDVAKLAPLPFAPIAEADRAAVARLCGERVRRWALAFCQVEATTKWADAFRSGGLRYMRTCIWRKPDGQPQLTGDRPGVGYEAICACHVPGKSRWHGGGRHGVFLHCTAPSHGSGLGHPTTKPIALMSELVGLFTDPGELVLDPYAGSGTTLRACKDLGRRAIGIEVNPDYCEIIVKRLRQEVLF
jgi:site-specific DNA-methyltransferase (adenine-specific)